MPRMPRTPEADAALERALHKTIHEVTGGIESFGFNAAIARLYAFTNALAKSEAGPEARRARRAHPGAAHGADDAAPRRGALGAAGRRRALCRRRPGPRRTRRCSSRTASRCRSRSTASAGARSRCRATLAVKEIERLALEAVARSLEGAAPSKVIVVPGRIVNVVA